MPHIKHNVGPYHETVNRSWCGAEIYFYDWVFQSLDHAAYASAAQDSVQVCVKCAQKAAKALLWQHESKECVSMQLLDDD